MSSYPTPFAGMSTMDRPRLEFAFEVRLKFERVQTIADMPAGATRSAVYVDEGRFEGPRLRGRAVPDSGGDWALFRPDNVISLDARYMLEEDDGTLILLYNRGYIWGRRPDTIDRLREWAFEDGEPVGHDEYYFRTVPNFEVPRGKHDWLMRYAFIGIGERKPDGNLIRYYAVL